MELANTRTAKARLSEYLNSIETRGPIIITSHSKPKAILVPFSEDDLASLVIQNSQEIHDAVMEGLLDLKKGKTLSIKEARRRLNDRNAA
ncbi:MAG: type II toxin-antitoxin system prevent-host-death family antitoxin [Actinobacteria bacterium]|nr:type II toxin-antitoxin system prevent-host-death family antitoxin [Actinomycetota bacterium]MBU2687134.1 type II toxin-antitoxin system prevent-host-death family antitoxin [Actinomycetota bacterium]